MFLIGPAIIRAQKLINYLRKLRIQSGKQNLIKAYLEIRSPAKLMRLIPVMKGTLTTGLLSSGARILVRRRVTKDGEEEQRDKNKDVDSALIPMMKRMLLRLAALMAGPILKVDYL